ncbi:MAG TPA: hypothetical protein VKC51_10325 [Lacunisphaera sp.]|nr:hypothetical protein [Lacunisphaera sp.]
MITNLLFTVVCLGVTIVVTQIATLSAARRWQAIRVKASSAGAIRRNLNAGRPGAAEGKSDRVSTRVLGKPATLNPLLP